MMKDFRSGVLEISIINGEVVVGVSVDSIAISMLLTAEECREFSSELFKAHLEAIGLKTPC